MISTKFTRVIPIAAVAVLTVGAAVFSTPASAQGCVDVDVSIDPPSVCSGEQTTITTSLENCGDTRDKVRARIMISGPGVDVGYRAVRKMKPGATRQVSRTLTVPGLKAPNVIRGSRLRDLPEGTYDVVVEARSKKGGSDMAMASLTITPCP